MEKAYLSGHDETTSSGIEGETYLSGHDETTSSGIDGDIFSHQSNILVFLITESFDRSCVYHSLLVSQRHGY